MTSLQDYLAQQGATFVACADLRGVPAEARPGYGYMWWLNTGKQALKDAPEHIYYAAGFGGNYIVVDEKNDLVVVVRWMGNLNDFMKIVLEAVKE